MHILGLPLIPTESELQSGGQESVFWISAPGDFYVPEVWDSALNHLILFLGLSFLV